MTDENEIERMEQLIDTATRAATKRFTDETSRWVKEHHSYDSRRDVESAHSKSIYREVAESLANAGIGDKEQAVKEFAEKLKEDAVTICFGNGISERLVPIKAIDNLITELYGEDE